MITTAPHTVLIFGGAGFIGSRIARLFAEKGFDVTVLDGLIEATGGRQENVSGLANVRLIAERIEDCDEIPSLIKNHSLIVDAMAWTAHILALRNPQRDLDLNVRSHLSWLSKIPADWPGRIIFLGSRGQYGNPKVDEISEQTPQIPEDIQGIHKVAAELHFRFFSRLRKVPVMSLRFPATVGPNQPISGDDIGLFGGFIRDLLQGKTVELFGNNRSRAVVHVDDVAEVIFRLSQSNSPGFEAFNLSGHNVALEEALKLLLRLTSTGNYAIQPVPEEIRTIDLGSLPVNESKLAQLIGQIPRHSLEATLSSAVDYFRSCTNES